MGGWPLVAHAVFALVPAEPIDLSWNAPADCPSGSAVLQRTYAALRESSAPIEGLAVRGTVRRTDAGFAMDLEVRQGLSATRRELVATTCAELGEAAALIMAVAIDQSAPRADGSSIVPVPEPAPPVDPTTNLPTAKAAGPVDDSRSARVDRPATEGSRDAVRRRGRRDGQASLSRSARDGDWLRISVQAVAGAGFASLPESVGVFEVAAATYARWWRAELGVGASTSARADSPSNPEVGGRFWSWSFRLRGCFAPGVSVVTFPLCIGGEAGAIQAEGTGALTAARSTSPWLSFLAGGGVRVTVWKRLQVLARAEAAVALARTTFETQPSGVVFERPAVGARVFGGVAVRLR